MTVDELIEAGDVVECAACGEHSAYAWDLVTARSEFRMDAETGQIAHVGAASCFEWECGHCGAHNVHRDAPILAEYYTHVEYE